LKVGFIRKRENPDGIAMVSLMNSYIRAEAEENEWLITQRLYRW